MRATSGLEEGGVLGSASAQWGAWFTGLLGASLAITGMYTLLPAPPAYLDYMTWAIVLVFIATLAKSYGDVRSLDRETAAANGQVKDLARANDVQAFLDGAGPSIFRAHIGALHGILVRHSEIGQDTLLELTHAKLAGRHRTTEQMSSLLMTLGLVGTIVGLLICVAPLGRLMRESGGDVSGIKDAIGHSLKGMGTAYFTTLLGAACGGVILRVLNGIVDRGTDRYIAHLAELTEVHVLPAMRRAAARLEREGYYRRLDEHGGAAA